MPNVIAKTKAAKFRARFGLSRFDLQDGDPDYCDVHDYLHTLVGALPTWQDEPAVYAVEEGIRSGAVPMPRGLQVANAGCEGRGSD